MTIKECEEVKNLKEKRKKNSKQIIKEKKVSIVLGKRADKTIKKYLKLVIKKKKKK